MDEEQIKIATTLAVPFVKELVEKYISPKIKELISKKGTSIKMTAHSFENQFESYLLDSYGKYSTPSILVLGNKKVNLKDIYIPLEIVNESDEKERHIINDFSDSLLPCHKKVLITDTAGMGKSTISKRLFLAAVEQGIGVPVLVELRRLNKNKTMLDEIFRQLSLIDEKADEGFVLELIKKGGFIFMLDGFDEIEHDERKFVVENIRDFIDKSNKNYFLLTSRPEDALNAFGDFMSFNIRPLYVKEAYQLLSKYDSKGELSSLLIRKLREKENKNIEEFLKNPLLVSLLFAAFEHKQTIPLKKHMFYRQVYDAFFERHDLTKGDSYIRNKYTKLESDDFHRVLRYIGYNSMRIDKVEFGKDELLKIIENAKGFCVDLKFRSSDFLKDILTKVPLFTEDGLYIKWAHKSIQEYFAANFIYNDSKAKQGDILSALAKEPGNRYYNVLDIYYSIDYKSFRRYIVYPFLKKYLEFAKEVKQVWPHINERVTVMLFVNEFVFMKGAADAVRFNNVMKLSKAFVKVQGIIDKYWSLRGEFFEGEDSLGFIKVFQIAKNYNSVLRNISGKHFDFFAQYDGRIVLNDKANKKRYLTKPTSDYSSLNIEEGQVYFLKAFDSDSIFKEVDINVLIDSFNSYYKYITEKKAIAFIKEVDREIIEEQTEDFLMSGLQS